MSPERQAVEAKAKSDDWQSRLSVIDDPAVTTGILVLLSKDDNPEVSCAAAAKVMFLKPKKRRRQKS